MNTRTKQARTLRRNQTLAEKILWSRLRNRQLNGFKFKRQYSIGNFIVDFCCSEVNLIIEIDGDVHGYKERMQKDRAREELLKSKNFKIVRYNNDEVYNNLKNVLEDIGRRCEMLRQKDTLVECPHPDPLPKGEGT